MNRNRTMRHLGVWACPAWCAQAGDEHDNGAHVGVQLTYLTEAGDLVWARPVAAWGGPGARPEIGDPDIRFVEMDRVLSEMVLEEGGLSPWHLTAADIVGLATILNDAELQLADWLDHGDQPICEWVWAYPRAEQDQAAWFDQLADQEATG